MKTIKAMLRLSRRLAHTLWWSKLGSYFPSITTTKPIIKGNSDLFEIPVSRCKVHMFMCTTSLGREEDQCQVSICKWYNCTYVSPPPPKFLISQPLILSTLETENATEILYTYCRSTVTFTSFSKSSTWQHYIYLTLVSPIKIMWNNIWNSTSSYTRNSIISIFLMLFLLLYPETLRNGCA